MLTEKHRAQLLESFADVLDEAGLDQLAERIARCWVITVETGRSIRVGSQGNPEPVLNLTAQPDGQIRPEVGNPPWMNKLNRDLVWQHLLDMEITFPSTGWDQWWWMERHQWRASERETLEWMQERGFPGQQQTQMAVSRLAVPICECLKTPGAKHRQLNDALLGMADPEVLRAARRHRKSRVTLHRYNNVARLGAGTFRELEKTHPGALTYLVERMPGHAPDPKTPERALDLFYEMLRSEGIHPARRIHQHLARLPRVYMAGMIRKSKSPNHLLRMMESTGEICQSVSAGNSAMRDAVQRMQTAMQSNFNNKTRQRAEEALVAVLEPETHRLVRQVAAPTTLNRRNLAMMGWEPLLRLRKTSPTLLAWAMHAEQFPEPVPHPGELVKLVRSRMINSGLEPASWKTFVKTDPKWTKAMLKTTCTREQMASMMNAVREAGTHPSAELAGRVNRALYRVPETHRAFLVLLYRESARRLELDPGDRQQEDLAGQAMDAWDYLVAMNREGITFRCRTWRRLCRHSDEWHQRMAAQDVEEQYRSLMEKQGGVEYAWDSLLPTVQEIQGLRVTHLGTQRELLEESALMKHCVSSYAERCQQGKSRIYGLDKEGRRCYTGEITRRGGVWQVNQVRGRKNGPPGNDARDVMNEIARRYTRAWREALEKAPGITGEEAGRRAPARQEAED